jgi:hypothetical protein
MTQSDIIRKLLLKNPSATKKGLARILMDKYPKVFTNLEHTRKMVRFVTGSLGKSNIHKKTEHTKFYSLGFEKWSAENLNTEERPWDSPFTIPNSIPHLNIIADLHSVNLCSKTMQAFLKHTKDRTAVLINGDLMDSESLSRHLKLHNVVEYERELEICHNLLKGLKEEFTHVYFKAGNHDFWLERYLLSNAREIFRLRGLQIEELLQCAAIGVHYISNLRYIEYGDLDIIHGHEFASSFGNGKFPSVGYVDKWQTFKGRYDVKLLASHCHRQDYSISRRSKDGKYGQGWVTPAMCRKSAQYNPYAGWDNGWAVARNNDGKVSVEIVVV